jgi:outer membrane biosynthesis protein TonB
LNIFKEEDEKVIKEEPESSKHEEEEKEVKQQEKSNKDENQPEPVVEPIHNSKDKSKEVEKQNSPKEDKPEPAEEEKDNQDEPVGGGFVGFQNDDYEEETDKYAERMTLMYETYTIGEVIGAGVFSEVRKVIWTVIPLPKLIIFY